ncbi:MAG: membrane protein insertase YidC [Alphaproteobacteria bacterium]|nr:membrane protein insertase YidC [Alphaproteobacteria bacterium]MDE2335809.1 membrane protein insertase YidC [Alphaproteobacteria bacterium]
MTTPSPNDQQDNGRMMIAVLISLAILVAYHFLVQKPQEVALQRLKQEQTLAQKGAAEIPSAPAAAAQSAPAFLPRAQALRGSPRIAIRGDKVTGSISLTGARLDDLSLNDQYLTIAKKNHVELLSPDGAKNAYYAEGGWTSDDKSTVLPDEKTVWRLSPGSAQELVSGGSVTLQWDNGHGLLFTRTISLDKNYLFTVAQSVKNDTQKTLTLSAWNLISRHGEPGGFKSAYVHEGPVYDLNGTLKEISYKDLTEGKTYSADGASGWIGITDKYWFVGFFTPQGEKFDARVLGTGDAKHPGFQTDIVSPLQTLKPGQTVTDTKYVFAGIKHLPLIRAYEKQYAFPRMELMIDFGILSFIVKPFFLFLHFLFRETGSVGWSIILLTVILRAAMFPLANRAFRSMAGMKKIAPQLKELQAQYKDNREKLQMEIFELYKRENVNPFGGCWPMLVQVPIFIALYKSILLSVEMRHAPFWGWIHDLSAADPTNVFTAFGLIPWTPPAMLHIGAWPLLYGLTMFLTQRLSPPAPDQTQNQIMTFMPLIFTFMFAKFSSGLVIYFTCSGIASLLQQYYIMRTTGGQDVSLLRGHGDRYKKKKKSHG